MKPRLETFYQGLTPDMLERAKAELGETEEVRALKLNELKYLIQKEQDFYPCMDDGYLLRYLRARKFDANRAFKTLKNYYAYKATYSGNITDLRPSDIKPVLNEAQAAIFEYRDQNDIAVGIVRLGQFDLEKVQLDDILACCLLFFELGLQPEFTQIVGYTLIVDYSGMSLGKAKKYASPTFIRRVLSIVQDCMPCRIKAYHFINEPLYVDIILNIAWPFMSAKLKKRVHFHGNNMQSLHQFVPPDILPEELGGTRGTISECARKSNDRIFKLEDYITNMNKFGYQGETLRRLNKRM